MEAAVRFDKFCELYQYSIILPALLCIAKINGGILTTHMYRAFTFVALVRVS